MAASSIQIGEHTLEVLDIDATQLNVRPFLLLHEGLGSVSQWRDFPQSLAAMSGARVVAYSRYGYGQSTPLPIHARSVRAVDYMEYEAVEVLPALIKALHLERPILVGHSDGGSIALVFAGMFPQQLSALAVMAPHCFVEDISVNSIAQAKVAFETTDLRQRLAKHHRDPAATFWGWNDIWLSPAFRAWNIEHYLPTIQCPVIAMQGIDDQYGTMAQIQAIRQAVPHAALIEIAQCGHAAWKDQPEIVLIALGRLAKSAH